MRPSRTRVTSGLERDATSNDEVLVVMRFVTRQRLNYAGLITASVVAGACTSSTDLDGQSPCADARPLMVNIGPAGAAVTVGQSVQLNVLLRCGLDGPTVSTTWRWISSNPDVVSVDASGLASGVSLGTATLTATSLRYPFAAASIAVRSIVFTSFVPSIQPSAVIMAPGAVTQFRATVSEEPNAPIAWSIDHLEIVTVDALGIVRAPRCGVLGAAIVTARHAVDPTLSASAAITVRDPSTGHIGIQFARDSISNLPADFAHVRGTVVIRVGLDDRLVECDRVSRVEVVVRSSRGDENVMIANRPIYPETTADVYFDTAARGSSGETRTPNGAYSITARVFDPQARLIEETEPISITLDNP